MADIILKDRNGEEVIHKVVKTIKMQNTEGTYTPYHILPGNMSFYIIRSGSASDLYYVVGRPLFTFYENYGCLSVIPDVYDPESGYTSSDYTGNFGMVVTTKVLQTGHEYTYDEMLR